MQTPGTFSKLWKVEFLNLKLKDREIHHKDLSA